MLFRILVFVEVLFSTLGIIIFDYIPDKAINQPGVIIASIFAGLLMNLIITVGYVEIAYIIYKKHPINSIKKHRVAIFLTSLAINVGNIKIKVIGQENIPKDHHYSIYSNHISLYDIPVQMKVFKDAPIAFVAKQILKKTPFVGKWLEAIGCVMIDRENSRKGAESIIQSIKQVKNGQPMVIYPEGTRYKDGKCEDLLPFKTGAFKLALKSKYPILPITLISTNIQKRTKWPRRNYYSVIIHKPVPYESFSHLLTKDLSNMIRDIIIGPLLNTNE